MACATQTQREAHAVIPKHDGGQMHRGGVHLNSRFYGQLRP
jgi:hypothetical protein